MPSGIYDRTPTVKAAMIARITSDASKAAMQAARPRLSGGYAQRGIGNRVVGAHRVRAERALGKPMPERAEVHHADGTKRPDAPLVICPDAAYHKGLHNRMRIQAAGGNPWTDRVCARCRVAKPQTDFSYDARAYDRRRASCRACNNADRRRKTLDRRTFASAN